MTFKELRKSAFMTQREFAEYFNIPLRTIENWEADSEKCKPYLLDLMEYKLHNPIRSAWKKSRIGQYGENYRYECPICGFHTGNMGEKFNFCPSCGSCMSEK